MDAFVKRFGVTVAQVKADLRQVRMQKDERIVAFLDRVDAITS